MLWRGRLRIASSVLAGLIVSAILTMVAPKTYDARVDLQLAPGDAVAMREAHSIALWMESREFERELAAARPGSATGWLGSHAPRAEVLARAEHGAGRLRIRARASSATEAMALASAAADVVIARAARTADIPSSARGRPVETPQTAPAPPVRRLGEATVWRQDIHPALTGTILPGAAAGLLLGIVWTTLAAPRRGTASADR